MCFKNIVKNATYIIKNNPKNFYKIKNYLETMNDIDINIFKKFFNKKSNNAYERLQIGESYRNKEYDYSLELYLIKWNKYSTSKIHNHSKYGCCMKIIEGGLLEDIYDKDLKILDNKIYTKNKVGYINDDIGYHKIFNYYSGNTYSLHLYCDSLYTTEIKYFEV